MPDFSSILSGLLGGSPPPMEVAGVPGDAGAPLPPPRPEELGGAAAPKVLAQLRKPQAAGAADPFATLGASGGKMPAPSSSKWGAALQGIDHGLTSIAAGRKDEASSRAATLKARVDMAKSLFDMDRRLATERREDRKLDFDQGKKFDTTARQTDERTAAYREAAKGKPGRPSDPLEREKKVGELLGKHPSSVALAADDEAPTHRKMPPARRAELEGARKAEEARLRALGVETTEAPAAAGPPPLPPTVASETAAAPASPPVNRDEALSSAQDAVRRGADPAQVSERLTGMGIQIPGGFFATPGDDF